MLSSLMGWMIIGLAIAYVARMDRRENVAEEGGAAAVQGATQNSPGGRDWCEALEAFHGGASLLFDSSLKLVAAGSNAHRDFKGLADARHLIDIIPPDAVEAFLEGIAAVRRGHKRSWECSVDGRPCLISAAPVGNEQTAIIIGGQRWAPGG